MKFLLGTKQHMTQIFDEDGAVHPATAVQAGPVTVIDIKTEERDGYSAVVVGFGEVKKSKLNKAQAGRMPGDVGFRHLYECRVDPGDLADVSIGDEIDLTAFEVGDVVSVAGTSKGKGFQGGVKRHGFAGGPRTHGQKHSEREVGSIGATGPQRVFKGTRMPGRMGGERVTTRNLSIVHIDPDTGTLYIKGAVPGSKGGIVEIRKT